jgi:hypothetical protein
MRARVRELAAALLAPPPAALHRLLLWPGYDTGRATRSAALLAADAAGTLVDMARDTHEARCVHCAEAGVTPPRRAANKRPREGPETENEGHTQSRVLSLLAAYRMLTGVALSVHDPSSPVDAEQTGTRSLVPPASS